MQIYYSLETSTDTIEFLKKNALIMMGQIEELKKKAKELGVTELDVLLKLFPENEESVARIIRKLYGTKKTYDATPQDQFFRVDDMPGVIFVKRGDKKEPLLLTHDPQYVSEYFNYVVEQTVVLPWSELQTITAQKLPAANPAEIDALVLGSPDVSIQDVRIKQEKSDDGIDEDAVRQLDKLIDEAIKKNASDVHLEVDSDEDGILYYKVRYRIDGTLIEVHRSKNLEVFAGMLSQIKLKAGLKLDETRLPQDGRMNYMLKGQTYSFRISTKPVVVVDMKKAGENQKEKVVIRKMPDVSNLSLDSLHFHAYNLTKLREISELANGFNVITGPTGSGKTTTLYALLSSIDRVTKNVSTIEDPVEAEIKGINQTQILPEIGLTFARVLRAELRQDPDIIMVGEMRDRETAEIATEASLTGHLVLSTLHTKDAVSSITRLINMGVPNFIVASALSSCLAQRLVRKLCPHCKEKVADPKPIIEQYIKPAMAKIKNPEVKKLFKEAYDQMEIATEHRGGCKACNKAGYTGRAAILEIFLLNPTAEEIILRKNADEMLLQEEAEKSGMLTIELDGLIKVMQGLTSVEELYSVLVA